MFEHAGRAVACTMWHSSNEAEKRPAEYLGHRCKMQTQPQMQDCSSGAADVLVISACFLAAYPKHSSHDSEGGLCLTVYALHIVRSSARLLLSAHLLICLQ